MANLPTVIGRYQVIRAIGHGGMGALYLAWDEKLERQIAIKVLREDDEQMRERFAREAKSAARLRHPNIVTIFELGEYEGQPYIAMEFIQGRTLGELIRAREPLALARKLELIACLCDGLGFAHKAGVVHRDIKPANIMIDDEGALKILDFGIARIAESASMTQAGMMLGTLNYMSPEQITGLPVDQRTDIFAVGVVCYELLAYRQAFPGTISTGVLAKMLHGEPEPLATVCPGLDDDVIRIVAKAIEKDAANRYQDLSAMRREALAVRARLDASAPSVTTVADTPGPVRPLPMTPAPTPRRPGTDRQELEKRRASQVQYYLDLADRAIAEERYDSAIAACEQTLLLDADNSRAADLSNRARTALEARQAKELLAEAERALQKGALTTAADLLNQAGTLQSSPRQVELRRAVDLAIRERDKARQRTEAVRDAVSRAQSAFDARSFTEAVRLADEALQLEPTHTGAASLKALALEAQTRVAREALDRRARDVVQEARQTFARGDHAVAIALLEKFEPPHEVVLHAQSELQAEAERIAEARRVEAAARAVKQRIAGGLALAREELRDHRFTSALERLRALQRTEGASPEISALVQEVTEAERTHRETEERASRERKAAIAAALEMGRDAPSNDEAMDALTRVLELDPHHEEAKTLLMARHQVREQESLEKTVVVSRQPAPPAAPVITPDDGTREPTADFTREIPIRARTPVPAPLPEPVKRGEPGPTPVKADRSEPRPAARGGIGMIGVVAAAVVVLAVVGYFMFRPGGQPPPAEPSGEKTAKAADAANQGPPPPPPPPPVDPAFAKAMQTARASLTAGRFAAAVQQFDALKQTNASEFANQGLAAQRSQAADHWADEIADGAQALLKQGKLNDARKKFEDAGNVARTAAVLSGLKLLDDRRAEFARQWQAAEGATNRQAFLDAVADYQKAQEADPEQFRAQGGPSKLAQAQGKLNGADKAAADAAERSRVEGLRASATATVNQGRELARQRHYDEADAKYQEALLADGTNKDALDALARSHRYTGLKSKGLSEFQSNSLDAAAKDLVEARDTDPERFAADGLDKTLSDVAARRAQPVTTGTATPDPRDAIRAAIDKLARALSTDTNPAKDINQVKQAWPNYSGGNPFDTIKTRTWTFTALTFTSVTDTEAVVRAERHANAVDSRDKPVVNNDPVVLTLEKANGTWVVRSMK